MAKIKKKLLINLKISLCLKNKFRKINLFLEFINILVNKNYAINYF